MSDALHLATPTKAKRLPSSHATNRIANAPAVAADAPVAGLRFPILLQDGRPMTGQSGAPLVKQG